MLPLLPPEDHYQISRDLRDWRDWRGSRREARHLSSLDLHELGGARNAPRPDPVWIAIRRTADRIGRLAMVQRLQHSLERLSDRKTETARPEHATGGMRRGDPVADTGRVAPRC